MSLENQIAALTAAIDGLTVALRHNTAAVAGGAPPPPGTKVVRSKVAAAGPEPKDTLENPNYDEVKALFLRYIKAAGHDSAVELLDKFGVVKLPALPAEKFGEMARMLEPLLDGCDKAP